MFNFLKPQKSLILAGCSLLLACGITSCSKYDLDETDPEGWGASIYSYLNEQGNYTNTVRMINDLGLAEVLAKTGSKTIFAADDEAFERFYSSNEWGVKRYEDLSESQKCLLLKGSVINNSYQINDLSSVEGPIEGQCMRRITSQDPGDTLALVNVAELPNMDEKDWVNNSTWKKLRDENLEKIYLLKDATLPPMMHFIEGYLTNNKITNDDYNFLFNNTTSRVSGDASVNGDNIIEHNIKCSNGFIHKVKEVMMPLKSIADIVDSKPQVSMWNELVLRFAVPRRITSENAIHAYQNRPDRDFSKYRLYERRFFSKKSQGGKVLNTDDDVCLVRRPADRHPRILRLPVAYLHSVVQSNPQTVLELCDEVILVDEQLEPFPVFRMDYPVCILLRHSEEVFAFLADLKLAVELVRGELLVI